jgi:outer membrane lipoprotein SlyB
MKKTVLIFLLVTGFTVNTVLAQSVGQSATVSIGVIEQAESVELQSSGGSAGGAVVGAAAGYNIGSGKSSSRKRRNAVIGGAIGSKAGSSGTTPGMQYTVKMGDDSLIAIVSDQLGLKVGDCVSVEQSGNSTNIRQQDPAACNPAVKEAVADLQDEMIEDANECAQVKQELLDAKTVEEVEVATAKARILCN